jgi:hypothetical protein
MINLKKDEKFIDITFPKGKLSRSYAVSNFGRVISYKEKYDDGKMLGCADQRGFLVIRFRPVLESKVVDNVSIYIHRFIAEHFCDKKSVKHIYCVHKDRNRSNNMYTNLKWVTKEEKDAFVMESPLVQARILKSKSVGHKLTDKKAKEIKNKIFDPNRKMKLTEIAKQFGVSSMCVHRIKTGQNWSHIQSDYTDEESVKRITQNKNKKKK